VSFPSPVIAFKTAPVFFFNHRAWVFWVRPGFVSFLSFSPLRIWSLARRMGGALSDSFPANFDCQSK
jgi:hypothetical protein